jgi:hypothetical protein
VNPPPRFGANSRNGPEQRGRFDVGPRLRLRPPPVSLTFDRATGDTYQTYMTESLAELNRNAPVKYRGVDVGRVRKIALAPGNVQQVELTLDVERGTPIRGPGE